MRCCKLFAAIIITLAAFAGVLAITDTAFADPCTDSSEWCYFQWQEAEAACDEFEDPQEFRECQRAAVADFMQCQTTCDPYCI